MAGRRGDAERLAVGEVQQRLDRTGGVDVTASMPIANAGRAWLGQIQRTDSGVSPSSYTQYVRAYEKYLISDESSLKSLTLEQVNAPQRLRSFLQSVADRHGTGSAKLSKTVVSGILNYAVENGVLPMNAVLQVRPVRSQIERPRHRNHRRSMTPDEERCLQTLADERAAQPLLNPRTRRKRKALADLIALMLGTGMRVSEARLIRWQHIDLASGRIQVHGTKTVSSRRGLNLPDRLVARLRQRAASNGTDGLVFPSPALMGSPEAEWSMRAVQREFRAVLDNAGLSWAVTHTMRRTVATKLDEAGVPVRRIADQLGQKDVRTTQSAYLGRDFEGDKTDLAGLL